MTFAAMPAWYAWLLLLAATAAAAWIFLIKLRPPRTLVPSLLLWQKVLDESRERTLWERIRRAVSLAVTVAIALMLALAAVQPQRRLSPQSARSGRRLIVLDSSLTMMARTSTGETRWERAVAQAKRLSAAAAGEVALATTADGLVEGPTADRALIDAALDRLAPTGSDRTLWPHVAAAADVHFVTDGALARAVDADVVVHSVFEAAANVAITAFAVRPSFDPDRAADAYLEVANYAPSAQQVKVVLTRGAMPILDRTLDMSAGESLRQVIPIARGGGEALRTRVEARHNALAIDDEAFAWVDRARPLNVVIVSDDPAWLSSLLARDPSVRGSISSTAGYPNGVEDVDLIVFDRWAPSSPPRIPALYVAPPRAASWLFGAENASAADEARPRWERTSAHAVVRGIDPATLTIERAHSYSGPQLLPVAQSARGTPLVSVVETPEQRAVIVAFGPRDSNLTSAPAFPVLIGNAIDWLTAPFGHASRTPGLAALNDTVSAIAGPRGTSVPVSHVNHAALGVLSAPGLYTVQGRGGRGTIAVNAGDPRLSDLTKTTLSGANKDDSVRPGIGARPWWIYAAFFAFLLAAAEWWTWQRRITV
jgi:hypothetical protein